MKTNYVPAIVMLLAGGVYCLFGIRYQVPLWDFSVQLLLVLLIFWVIGGIIRMVLDKFMTEFADKTKETEDEENSEEEDSDEKAEKTQEEESASSEDDE